MTVSDKGRQNREEGQGQAGKAANNFSERTVMHDMKYVIS
jgi:hypothetical protein